MAKGQMRSNREQKKPKKDAAKTKAAAAPADSPFKNSLSAAAMKKKG